MTCEKRSPSLQAAAWSAGLRRLVRLHWMPQAQRRWIGKQLAAYTRFRQVMSFRGTSGAGPGPLVMAGFFSSALGIGEAARLLRDSLAAIGMKAASVDLSGDIAPADMMVEESGAAPAAIAKALSMPGGVFLLCVNAPEVLHVLSLTPREAYAGRYRIGYWHWELPKLPQSWSATAELFNEIWMSSEFSARIARDTLKRPVRVMPPVVKPLPAGPGRQALGLPEAELLVYSAFDMRSSLARKNPLGNVMAFKQAYGRDPGIRLLLKANRLDMHDPLYEILRAAINDHPNITLINEIWPAEKVHHVIQQVDVILSLHRAEGYGLTLAEGMAYGKVVVATGWSGNMDFMTADCSMPVGFDLVPIRDPQRVYGGDGQWAEPRLDEAVEALRRLYADPALRRRLGEAAKRRMQELSSKAAIRTAVGAAFLARMQEDGHD